MAKGAGHRLMIAVGVCLLTLASYAQWYNPAEDVPAYHPQAPLKLSSLPPVLSGKQLTGPSFREPWQRHAYETAARIQGVLYQLPCYCRCDRSMGHQSLRSCFESLHGAECQACAAEAFYAEDQLRAGKTVGQIRQAIEQHAWSSIDLSRR